MTDSLATLPWLAALALPVLLSLPGCSSGGDGSASPAGGGSSGGTAISLFFDTAAGSEWELEARLVAVSLESVDAGLTADLLGGEVPLTLARPDGEGELVPLQGVPRGVFTALHLMLAPGSVRARGLDGVAVPVVPRTHALRVELGRPWTVDGSRARLLLCHGGPLSLSVGAGGTVTWDPDVDLAPVDVVPIRFGRLEVVAVDRPNVRVSALLLSADQRPVDLTFARDALLLREPDLTPIGEAAFLDGLQVGSRLLVDGLLDVDDQLIATTAIDQGVSDPIGHGNKGELHGRILEMFPAREKFEVSLIEMRKGEHLLPVPTPRTLLVSAGEARIRWTPRRGRHPGHLSFAELVPGMVVDLSWHALSGAAEIVAEKIDIRSQGTVYDRAFEGEVTSVSSSPARLGLRLPAPVVIDGRDLQDLEIDVKEETLIVRESSSAVRIVDLADVQVGEVARVLLDARGRGRFKASLIVLPWQ